MFLYLIRKIQIENCSLNETILRWQLPHYHQKSEREGPRAVCISDRLPWPFIPNKPHKLTSTSCSILSNALSHSHQLLQRGQIPTSSDPLSPIPLCTFPFPSSVQCLNLPVSLCKSLVSQTSSLNVPLTSFLEQLELKPVSPLRFCFLATCFKW